MNLVELQRALRQLRLSGMAAGPEPRLLQAQTDTLAPIDFLSTLVSDELLRRQDRLLDRRLKQAAFRDAGKTLDAFDFDFNKKMNRRLVFELATGRFVAQHEDGLFLGPPGTGKSHLAQAIGVAVIQHGYRVLYREAHALIDELAEAPDRRRAQAIPRAGHHCPAPGPRDRKMNSSCTGLTTKPSLSDARPTWPDEYLGVDHIPWVGDQDSILDEVEEFLTGTRQHTEVDWVLRTVLVTNVVGSTAPAAARRDIRPV